MDTRQLTQELNFKVLDAVHNLLRDHERGLITRAEVKTGVRAIFDSVAGLVPTTTFNLLSEAAEEYKGAHGIEAYKYNGNGNILHVTGTGRVLHVNSVMSLKYPGYTDSDADAHAAAWCKKQAGS